jgi:hypothetical protein
MSSTRKYNPTDRVYSKRQWERRISQDMRDSLQEQTGFSPAQMSTYWQAFDSASRAGRMSQRDFQQAVKGTFYTTRFFFVWNSIGNIRSILGENLDFVLYLDFFAMSFSAHIGVVGILD